MVKIFWQAMNGLKVFRHDTILTFDSYLVNEQKSTWKQLKTGNQKCTT